MAYPILGTPIPAFFDSSGSPLASGTVTVTDPDTASAKAVYDSASDADSQSNGVTSAITLNSRGEPATELWGRDGEDYTLVIKDSDGSTVQTITDVRLPVGTVSVSKVKTANSSLTDTTLANDTHLSGWSLTPDTFYRITAYFIVSAAGATQDFVFDFTLDQTPQTDYMFYFANDSTTADAIEQTDQTALQDAITIDIDGTANVGIFVVATLETHATATTTLDLRVSQGTDSGTTTFRKGSWIKVEPLVV